MNIPAEFLVAALVLAVTPGPGIAYVAARTVAGGRGEGAASCLGTAVGGMVHVVAAALGLSLVVAQSAAAFTVVKFAGVAYLVWLGARMLLRGGDRANERSPVRASGTRRAFVEGIAVEALNVKTALFFISFLPQFVAPSRDVGAQLIVLGVVCVGLNTLADFVAVAAAHRLARGAQARVLERVSGATMVALAGWLAFARRNA